MTAAWKRRKNGSHELYDGDMLIAIVEPARHRGHWWWSTWGASVPDAAGYAFSMVTAQDLAERSAGGNNGGES